MNNLEVKDVISVIWISFVRFDENLVAKEIECFINDLKFLRLGKFTDLQVDIL